MHKLGTKFNETENSNLILTYQRLLARFWKMFWFLWHSSEVNMSDEQLWLYLCWLDISVIVGWYQELSPLCFVIDCSACEWVHFLILFCFKLWDFRWHETKFLKFLSGYSILILPNISLFVAILLRLIVKQKTAFRVLRFKRTVDSIWKSISDYLDCHILI